jgi:hypothetical protein
MTAPLDSPTPAGSLDSLRSRAQALASEQRYADAIDLASGVLRAGPDQALERLLVEWRCREFDTRPASQARQDWPPAYADPFPQLRGLPEIEKVRASVSGSTSLGSVKMSRGAGTMIAVLLKDLAARERAARFAIRSKPARTARTHTLVSTPPISAQAPQQTALLNVRMMARRPSRRENGGTLDHQGRRARWAS